MVCRQMKAAVAGLHVPEVLLKGQRRDAGVGRS
jgi:hypothetical protein